MVQLYKMVPGTTVCVIHAFNVLNRLCWNYKCLCRRVVDILLSATWRRASYYLVYKFFDFHHSL